MFNFDKYLSIAGVPVEHWEEFYQCMDDADYSSDGLVLKKWKVRIFKASKIAKMLSWENNRLIEVAPDLEDWDIAPMKNITANGDHVQWDAVGPIEDSWLNPDPESDEYKEAVAANYWAKGTHPRSLKSRKAWYRRNAGEFLAYKLGEKIDLSSGVDYWKGSTKDVFVEVYHCNGVYQFILQKKFIGNFGLTYRFGYEIGNIWWIHGGPPRQGWFPIDGYDLKAPVTWSVLPGRFKW